MATTCINFLTREVSFLICGVCVCVVHGCVSYFLLSEFFPICGVYVGGGHVHGCVSVFCICAGLGMCVYASTYEDTEVDVGTHS